MSSVGLNKWIVSGHLAADAEIKTVDLRSGEKAKVAKATIYVRKMRNRDESFTVSLSIWEGSSAWRKLPFLKKGSLIICTGGLEPNPYLSNSDNLPRAGLSMNVLDIDLDNVRNVDEEESPEISVQNAEIECDIAALSFGQSVQISKTSEKETLRVNTSNQVLPIVTEGPESLSVQSKQTVKSSAKM